MKVYVGADHNGFFLRRALIDYLQRAGYDVVDDGDEKLDPQDDFPLFASKVVNDVLGSDDAQPRGILLCGSGQGMCMAANRFKGIRAALGYDRVSVRAAREDDDANILCLPATTLDKDEANVLVETFLSAHFADSPRFRRRLAQLDDLPH
ncbi:ribose 5-phosphate isomerase B [soil metagenome]